MEWAFLQFRGQFNALLEIQLVSRLMASLDMFYSQVHTFPNYRAIALELQSEASTRLYYALAQSEGTAVWGFVIPICVPARPQLGIRDSSSRNGYNFD